MFPLLLMAAMASTSMLTTCMSFPMVVLMVRTLHIWIIIKCIIDKSFYEWAASVASFCIIALTSCITFKFSSSACIVSPACADTCWEIAEIV